MDTNIPLELIKKWRLFRKNCECHSWGKYSDFYTHLCKKDNICEIKSCKMIPLIKGTS